MRLLLTFIATGIFFCSCNNSTNSSSSNIDSTLSLTPPAKDTVKTIDSVTLMQSKIVYGDLKFGATEKEYNKAIKDFFQNVGNERYYFKPYYNSQKKLYTLEIEGFSETANYLDNEVYDHMNNLKEVISKKYGVPETTFPYPSIFDFKPGYIKWTNIWTVGTKKIKVGVMEVSSGSEYKAICWIYDEPMYEAVEKENDKKTDDTKSDDANKF